MVVRRSRKASIQTGELEFNPLVFEQGRYQLSAAFELQVDALEFASVLKNPNAQTLQQALELYQGEFMPYMTSEWANLKARASRLELSTHEPLLPIKKLTEPLKRMTAS